MVEREVESGRELVLDNRKLLVIFLVFFAICGVFFVWGFREGKRQGIQQGEQIAAETARKVSSADTQAPATKPLADASAIPPKENAGEQQLNWMENVKRKEGAPEIAHQTTAGGTVGAVKDSVLTTKTEKAPIKEQKVEPVAEPTKKPIAETIAAPKPQKTADVLPSSSIIYSVQVGAFRVKKEVESKAKALRAQKYDCRIEEPQSPEGLYLLKVGNYKTRAEATVMMNRLKKSGIKSIIKTN
jgi:cell division protein FtsN